MSSKRQNQVETVFAAARERPSTERAAFLAEVCAGDPDLRREVESLLAYDPHADALMEVPALDLVASDWIGWTQVFGRRHPWSI